MMACQPSLARHFQRRQEELGQDGSEPAENNGIDPEWTVVHRIIAKQFVYIVSTLSGL
jgi:hypothetical protein